MASYEDALSKMFEERLKVFYAKYDESKLSNVPTILTKYKGKEDQLFRALTQKYGPEPEPEGEGGDDDEGAENHNKNCGGGGGGGGGPSGHAACAPRGPVRVKAEAA